jgi:hypothetical protein
MIARATSGNCGCSLLERYGRAPRTTALDNKDLEAKDLLQHLFKRSHLPKCPEVVGLQQECSLVFTRDRCNDERSLHIRRA